MTVLLAESGRAVGGTERVVWELATRLPRARFDVRVWLSDDPGVDEFAAALAARGLPVERVAEVDSRWDLGGMLRTWGALRRVRPTLLHVHHVWPAADRYLASLAGLAGVPHLVVTEHIVGKSHSEAQRSLKRRELERADAVTVVCGAIAESLHRDYGIPRDRLRVVANGADRVEEGEEWQEARRWREKLGAGPVRPLFVSAARLEEQKGHDVFIDALAELQRRGLEFTAAIAGDGEQREPLERRAAAKSVQNRLKFLGRLEELGPLLLASDAVAMPSRWEGLPLTLLEALARGKPVVASAVGGVPDVIEDGVSGRLVPPDDAFQLADVLESFARRADAAIKLGRAGQRRVREQYSWERVVESFEMVYDEVLGLATFDPSRGAREEAPR